MIIQQLEKKKANLKCDELCYCLEVLGFQVREGRKQGHRVVTHPDIRDFFSTSYTCGHGKNPEIRSTYIRNIKKILLKHEQAIKIYLGESI